MQFVSAMSYNMYSIYGDHAKDTRLGLARLIHLTAKAVKSQP